MKSQVNFSSRDGKIFICREERRKAAWGHAGGSRNQWSHGSGWKLGFYNLFVLPKGRDVSQVQINFLGRRSVSLANYQLLGPSAVCPSIVLIIICYGEFLFCLCLFGILYLNGHHFLEIWGIFCYYFLEYITFTFGLHLFLDAHDFQVWSFYGVTEFLHIPFPSH
jgi:hypothetical protein